MKKILLIIINFLSLSILAQTLKVPYSLKNTPNQIIYFNSPDHIASDFGPRHLSTAKPYDWHGGIDYNDYTNGAGNGDLGCYIRAIEKGIVYKISAPNATKAIIIKGEHNFGYLHIFRNGGEQTLGDFELVKLNNNTFGIITPENKLLAECPFNNLTKTYDCSNIYYIDPNGIKITATNDVAVNMPIAPLGDSGFPGNAHLHVNNYESLIACTSWGTCDEYMLNPLEVIKHVSPNYELTIRNDNSASNPDNVNVGLEFSYPGHIPSKIMIRAKMSNESNPYPYKSTFDYNIISLFQKKTYEGDSKYNYFQGNNYYSQIRMGGTSLLYTDYPYYLNESYQNNQNTWGNWTRQGIFPFSFREASDGHGLFPNYVSSGPRPYDDFFFSDVITRIHKDDKIGSLLEVADNPQNLRYIDGNYHIQAYLKKTDNSIEDLKVIHSLDNFMPLIQEVSVYSEQKSDDIYGRKWNSVDKDKALVGDGYVEISKQTVKCALKDLSNPGKFYYTAISSEPLQNLTLNVKFLNGQSVVGVLQPIGGKAFDAPKNTVWKYETTFSSLNVGDKLILEFKGKDISGNDLIDTKQMLEGSKVYVPKRKKEGTYTATNVKSYWFNKTDKATMPTDKIVFGKDDFHVLEFDKCGQKLIPTDSSIVQKVAECFKHEEISHSKKHSNGSNGEIKILVNNAAPSNAAASIIWTKDDVELTQYAGLYTLTGLAEGTYCYEIKCECCTFSDCIEVEGCPDMFSEVITTDACTGLSNGTIKITASEGVAPYTFANTGLIFTVAGDVATASNVSNGTYSITITDAEGCIATQEITIESGGGITVAENITPICNDTQNDGAIALEPSNSDGSDDTFTYQWSNKATSESITDLTAGTYGVTVSNSQGCSVTQAYTILPKVPLQGKVTINTGDILIGAQGQYPIRYDIDKTNYNGSLTDKNDIKTITDLAAGTYIVRFTDSIGCTDLVSITIGSTCKNSAIAIVSEATLVNNSTYDNGTITLNVSNGNPSSYPLSVSLIGDNLNEHRDNINGLYVNTFLGLKVGQYTLRVKDKNGCIESKIIEVLDCDALTSLVSTSTLITTDIAECPWSVKFNYKAQGISNIQGVLRPHLLSERRHKNGKDAVIVLEEEECYKVVVKGDGACDFKYNEVLGEKCIKPSCNFKALIGNNNGDCSLKEIEIIAGAGYTLCDLPHLNRPISYEWSHSTENLGKISFDVNAGAQTSVTITDGNGCVQVERFDFDPVNVIAKGSDCDNPCINLNLERLSNPPYTVTYKGTKQDDENTVSGNSICGLSEDDYAIKITDAAGCQFSTNVVINSVASTMKVNYNVTPCTWHLNKDGKIGLSITDGVKPYSYTLVGVNRQETSLVYDGDYQVFDKLGAGHYTLLVQDGSGCMKSFDINVYFCGYPQTISRAFSVKPITEVSSLGCMKTPLTAEFDYDEPTKKVSINITGDGPFQLKLITNNATKLSTQLDVFLDLGALPDGNHYVNITDNNGCPSYYQLTLNTYLKSGSDNPEYDFWNVEGVVRDIKGFCEPGSITIKPFAAALSPKIKYYWTGPILELDDLPNSPYQLVVEQANRPIERQLIIKNN